MYDFLHAFLVFLLAFLLPCKRSCISIERPFSGKDWTDFKPVLMFEKGFQTSITMEEVQYQHPINPNLKPLLATEFENNPCLGKRPPGPSPFESTSSATLQPTKHMIRVKKLVKDPDKRVVRDLVHAHHVILRVNHQQVPILHSHLLPVDRHPTPSPVPSVAFNLLWWTQESQSALSCDIGRCDCKEQVDRICKLLIVEYLAATIF